MTKMKQKGIQNYCKEHSNQDSLLLTELEKYTWDNEDVPQMISGSHVGNFLQGLIKASKAGIDIVFGTDAGSPVVPRDAIVPEMKFMVDMGLVKNNIQAIQRVLEKNEGHITIDANGFLEMQGLKKICFITYFIKNIMFVH